MTGENKGLAGLLLRAFLTALLLCLAAARGDAQFFETERTTEGVREFAFVTVTDGTQLATDYYLPSKEGGPWPVLLVRSTYGRNFNYDGHIRGGYAVVAQDLRGMGGSGGEGHVFYYDGWRTGITDGKDTVDWIRAQPWCNGKIGTMGESALAMTQVMLAPATRHVAAQFMELVPTNFYHDVVYHGGVFKKNLVEGWLMLVGQPQITDLYKSHPRYNEFWSYYNSNAQAGSITAPGMFVNGWYDIFSQGTINGFLSRERNGGEGARGANYLIMRWNTHTSARSPDYKLRDNADDVRESELRKKFFDYHLKGDSHALEGMPKVQYYVLGDDRDPNAPGNVWRSSDTWPPGSVTEKAFFLHGDSRMDAGAPGADEPALGFVFDPRDPYPTHGGANLLPNLVAGPYDQRLYSGSRTDLIKFATAPLAEPLEIAGHVRVVLYVSSDAPDTDFTAKLVDIFPEGDGREINILDNIRRVKTRMGYETAAPPLNGPEQVVELEIDMWHTAWAFNKGHRIGLHVSSSNFPRFEVNPNTGEDHPVDGGEMRAAGNRVHFSPSRPSALYLPVSAAES